MLRHVLSYASYTTDGTTADSPTTYRYFALYVPETFIATIEDISKMCESYAITRAVGKLNVMLINVESRDEARMVLVQCVKIQNVSLSQQKAFYWPD